LLNVLEVLLQASDQACGDEAKLHGWAIMKAAKRSAPTVYGVLDRLRRWMDHLSLGRPHPEENKPRRRFCRLTPTGIIDTRDLLTVCRPKRSTVHDSPAPHLAFPRWLSAPLTGRAL
jgi:PadR family transcriptional regulator PadR